MSEKINNKLLKLGIKLPRPADPVASYLPYVISGNLLFISGQGPFNEKGLITGKVGSDLTLDEGKDATLFISDGDPLEIRTNIIQAYIQGKKIDMGDRHKSLYSKYIQNIVKLEF